MNLRGKQLKAMEDRIEQGKSPNPEPRSKPEPREKPKAKKPARTMSQADFSGYAKGGMVKRGYGAARGGGKKC